MDKSKIICVFIYPDQDRYLLARQVDRWRQRDRWIDIESKVMVRGGVGVGGNPAPIDCAGSKATLFYQ